MVLHTDQPHPHVHVVVKCEHEFEPGKRLYIRKETLRQWREQFAALMREQGVAANATPRQVRGQVRKPLKDPIHHRLRALRAFGELSPAERALRRPPRSSTFMRNKLATMIRAEKDERPRTEEGRAGLISTREQVENDWRASAESLRRGGFEALAVRVERFLSRLPPVLTDAERMAQRWTRESQRPTPAQRAATAKERSR
jgi:hypothetical protein